MVVRVPETTRETTYIERSTFVERSEQPAPVVQPVEPITEKLPVVTPPPAQVVVITQPERSKDERESLPPQDPGNGSTRGYQPRTSVPETEVSPAPVVSQLPHAVPVAETGSSAPVEPREVREPEVKPERKSLTPDNKNVNEPIKFSQPEPAPQAKSRPKMKHVARTRGRQRKFHQTIALLEDYRDGNTEQFERLDEQMQRYYRREYAEYFGRESAAKANQRLANRTKAARTRRQAEQREIAKISRSIQGIPDHGSEELDVQSAGA